MGNGAFIWDPKCVTIKRSDPATGEFVPHNYFCADKNSWLEDAVNTIFKGAQRGNLRIEQPLEIQSEIFTQSGSEVNKFSFSNNAANTAFANLIQIPQYELEPNGPFLEIEWCPRTKTYLISIATKNPDGSLKYVELIPRLSWFSDCGKTITSFFGPFEERPARYSVTVFRTLGYWRGERYSTQTGPSSSKMWDFKPSDLAKLQTCFTNEQIIRLAGLKPYRV
eukprot:TRINITY_DN17856_c0_g1_i1.p1 TRINITY_DN17856_c0_g1~~TRINITY_DN17856_c0_g1_i1.p1  ORF type:complete len:223 (-),score=26.99 TRINITY_DN17856_c0_g1_i1:99-767(-)